MDWNVCVEDPFQNVHMYIYTRYAKEKLHSVIRLLCTAIYIDFACCIGTELSRPQQFTFCFHLICLIIERR
jgi:hypothetical protein